LEVRYYCDADTGLPHIHGHGVTEKEVEDVLRRPVEILPGRRRSRVLIGHAGWTGSEGDLSPGRRWFRRVRGDGTRVARKAIAGVQTAKRAARWAMKKTIRKRRPINRFPKDWDERKIKALIAHYESQSEDEAAAEDEAAYNSTRTTMMAVPVELVPQVQRLIEKRAG
jgi:hypothetical protein